MHTNDIQLVELFKTPQKWRSVSPYDIVTKYADEALKEKKTFLNYLQHMYMYNPWAIEAFVMGAPNSIYGLKEIFRNEIKFLPPEPKYDYGSQTLIQVLKDIEKCYENKSINNEQYRKRLLYKAAETLSKDDYKIFMLVMNNEFSEQIYTFIEEFYNEQNLPEIIARRFMFSFKTDALYTVPEDVFNNNTNSEYVYITNNDLEYYRLYRSTILKVNDKNEKLYVSLDAANPLHRNLIRHAEVNQHNDIPDIAICDGEHIIGTIRKEGVFLYVMPSEMTEHVFSTKICEGLKHAFIIDKDSIRPHARPKVKGTISYSTGTLKRCVKQVDSFSVSILPYCGYSSSIITCKEKNTENNFPVFALTEKANNLSKNLKNFKLAEMLGRFFYIG